MHPDIAQNDNFISYGCDEPLVPILLATPHAGRDYPPSLMDDIRIAPDQLVRLEDRYVDILVKQSAGDNIPTLIARTPRTIIDLNRSEHEVDADMVTGLDWNDVAHPSVKTRGGLGLIPRRLNGAGEIWNKPIFKDDVVTRIAQVHRPYHDFVELVLDRMVQKFGVALLIDVHSMPTLSTPMPNGKIAQWVIGDRYGASADNIFSDLMTGYLKREGYNVALNSPYSGGYILERHGKPAKQRHAVQIEIDRNLYLDMAHREPIEGMVLLSNQIKALVEVLLEYLNQSQQLEAAE